MARSANRHDAGSARRDGEASMRRWLPSAIAVLAATAGFTACAADSPTPGVLILHSNQRPTPAQVVIDDTLRTVVAEGFKRPVQLFSEYLDDEWALLEKYGAAEAEFLRDKYGTRSVRVIVADALPALRFATAFRDRILPGAPVVLIAVARDRADRTTLPADVVGNFEDLDPTPTLQLAKRLHPDAKHLVLVRGASELDRLWDRRLRAAVDRLEGAFEIEYLSGLTSAEVLRRVSALSKDTVVFTPGYFIDGAGEVSTPRQSVERIARASPVPVYGSFDTLLGTGIMGGYMTRYEDQAKDAGAIVVRLLNGTAPAEIATSSVARVPMVDWRQLRRWNIDERLLPAGTVVMFREPTAWDKYGLELSIGVAVLLLQAALIAALLLERRSRRRTAAALAASQEQMTLAASAARLSLWIWDAARNKLKATALPWQRSDQRTNRPIAFADVVQSVHPADREGLERAVRKALATGEELDVEYRVLDGSGGVRWVAARGRAENGVSGRLVGVALDVTERKAADLRAAQDRTALRQMTRAATAGQLSAAIAHQLNQPLAAILGNAEAAQRMLGRDGIDREELIAICKDIVSEDHRASSVIRRLSELYKRGDMKVEPIDVNGLIRETLDLLSTELLIRHVTAATDLAPTLPPIEGGYVQLQQVVLNLVLNAADAMGEARPEERRLTIRTESHGPRVQVYVIDSGSGIAPDHLKSVFDPFWSTKEGGMGMGLAICQSIIAAHRGSITAENNAEGGATFRIMLPTSQHAWT